MGESERGQAALPDLETLELDLFIADIESLQAPQIKSS
jgi:hypothetical protein